MKSNGKLEALEAAVELLDDYRILHAEARSQLGMLRRMVEQTEQELGEIDARRDRGGLREASLTTALVRLREQQALWEGRLAAYAYYSRVIERRRDEQAGAS